MQFAMIGWYVPLSLYPAGYGENPKTPLPSVMRSLQLVIGQADRT